MSNVSMITGKKIQVYIKNGYSPETLAEKYSCTIEELKERIGQLYHAGNGARAAEIFSALEGNRRKPQRHLLKKLGASEENQVDAEPIPEEHSEESTKKSLTVLKEEEKNLSGEIMSIESSHKTLSGQHRNCAKVLRSLQEQLKEMLETVKGISGIIDQTESEADEVAQKMNDLSQLRREKLVALEKVRQEIEERSTVTICITNDGTIEVDAEDCIMNDDGYQNLKAELADRDECLDLRMREIVTLARLLKMTETIEKIVLICDNPELEKAFWAIRQ